MTKHAWQQSTLVENYLTGIRAALPLAKEQLDVMLHVVKASQTETVTSILDLGCGNGILGQLLLEQYPDARGVFIDFSEPMIEAARTKLDPTKASYFVHDLNDPSWRSVIPENAKPFDVIVSGYAIHHLTDKRKQSLYREIFDLLKPGGIFINIEHVASPDEWVERLFNEAFIDNLYDMNQRNQTKVTREEISRKIYSDEADDGDIPALTETQCAWLVDTGFIHVDCYMKIYALAVFGGVKPR